MKDKLSKRRVKKVRKKGTGNAGSSINLTCRRRRKRRVTLLLLINIVHLLLFPTTNCNTISDLSP